MEIKVGSFRYVSLLVFLSVMALTLFGRLLYVYLEFPVRFPINRVKVSADYQHITHKELETLLNAQLENANFFTLSLHRLQSALKSMPWASQVSVKRVWPDTISITLIEKKPLATWNAFLLTSDGEIFKPDTLDNAVSLPHLRGPANQYAEVLQIYKKLSKILTRYGLFMTALEKRENHAWELTLANGMQLHLGKRFLASRVKRFCRAYPAVFANQMVQSVRVDLRYPRGMAVQWHQ